MKFEVRVEINVNDDDPGMCIEEIAAVLEYEPTPEAPKPDEEWRREHIAIMRLKAVTGVTYVAITDTLED